MTEAVNDMEKQTDQNEAVYREQRQNKVLEIEAILKKYLPAKEGYQQIIM